MDIVKPTIIVQNLGLQKYQPIWQKMQNFTDQRTPETTDELWVVEHHSVFTQGQAGKPEHILAAADIPVIQVDRGGQVTYHGPGQLVIYPLIDLRRHGIGVKTLVHGIEQAIIDTAAEYDISAKRKEKAPGVYIHEKKLASLGLRIRRGCSFHGLAFNIDMDLEPFQRINPCGYAGLEVTQLSEHTNNPSLNKVSEQLIHHFCTQLHYNSALTEQAC